MEETLQGALLHGGHAFRIGREYLLQALDGVDRLALLDVGAVEELIVERDAVVLGIRGGLHDVSDAGAGAVAARVEGIDALRVGGACLVEEGVRLAHLTVEGVEDATHAAEIGWVHARAFAKSVQVATHQVGLLPRHAGRARGARGGGRHNFT